MARKPHDKSRRAAPPKPSTPAPGPQDGRVQEALEMLVQSDRAQFAGNLDSARVMWRKHRALVEAPEFPEPFRAAFVQEFDCEPDDDGDVGSEVLAPDHVEKQLQRAREFAWTRAAREPRPAAQAQAPSVRRATPQEVANSGLFVVGGRRAT